MKDARKLLELFDQNQEFYDEVVLKGIEKNRKGDAKITIIDTNGEVLKGANVLAVQQNHEFKFGANFFLLDEFETEEKNQLYKERFKELFNIATIAFYWRELEPEQGKPRYDKDSEKIYRRPPTDLCVEFCEQNGISPREHALCYDRFYPLWLKGAEKEQFKPLMKKRIQEVAERYEGRIESVEVCNEMTVRNGITKYYWDPEYTEWCHKTARKYFPNAILGINEGPTSCWNRPQDENNLYYNYIKEQLDRGTPIDAIGMQYHLFYKQDTIYESTRCYLDPKHMYASMDFFSQLVPNLQVTEISIPAYSYDADDEATQAEVLDKIYHVWFSHPATSEIIYWNFVDGYCYAPAPAGADPRSTIGMMAEGENNYFGGLLRFDLSPKPAFYKLKDMLTREWHTEQNMKTDDKGQVQFRGFYGEYNVTIDVHGKFVTKKVKISKKSDNDIEIRL